MTTHLRDGLANRFLRYILVLHHLRSTGRMSHKDSHPKTMLLDKRTLFPSTVMLPSLSPPTNFMKLDSRICHKTWGKCGW